MSHTFHICKLSDKVPYSNNSKNKIHLTQSKVNSGKVVNKGVLLWFRKNLKGTDLLTDILKRLIVIYLQAFWSFIFENITTQVIIFCTLQC